MIVIEDRRKKNLKEVMDRLKRKIRRRDTEKKAFKEVEKKGRKDLMRVKSEETEEKRGKKEKSGGEMILAQLPAVSTLCCECDV